MADLTITAANVISGNGADIAHGTAGASITAGQTVYRDPTTKKYLLADSNSGTVAARSPTAFALHAASDGQPLAVHREGPLSFGAILTPGVAYYQSDTPGGICPVADVGSGEYSTILGIATSSSVLDVDFRSSGVAL